MTHVDISLQGESPSMGEERIDPATSIAFTTKSTFAQKKRLPGLQCGTKEATGGDSSDSFSNDAANSPRMEKYVGHAKKSLRKQSLKLAFIHQNIQSSESG